MGASGAWGGGPMGSGSIIADIAGSRYTKIDPNMGPHWGGESIILCCFLGLVICFPAGIVERRLDKTP